MNTSINWHWPSTRANNWKPWYVILKNLLALPFIVLGAPLGISSILLLGVAVGIIHGPASAKFYVKGKFQE